MRQMLSQSHFYLVDKTEETMKFIHAADIHLGSPFQGLRKISSDVREKVIASTGEAYNKLVQDAIDNSVDFVCIVGDLFDNPEPDLETLNIAISGMDKLNEAEIPVYLSYGNHDYLNFKIPSNIFPKNVKIFGNQVETKTQTLQDGMTVAITGFSYTKRAEVNARIDEYPVKNQDVDFQIGMLHGSMDGINSTEAHYAPFTQSQLISKNYDYWALGHIHKRQEINSKPIIAYSGNTQGRHVNESGVKGVNLVTIDSKEKATVNFLETDVIEWNSIEVKAVAGMDLDKLIAAILREIGDETQSKFQLINVILRDSNVLDSVVLDDISSGLALMQIQKQVDPNEILFHRITMKANENIQMFSELDREFWEKSENLVFNSKTVQETLGRLIELDFIAEEYSDEEEAALVKDRVELMLKQRNVLGDE